MRQIEAEDRPRVTVDGRPVAELPLCRRRKGFGCESVIRVIQERVSLEAAERIHARLMELTREIAEADAGDTPVNVAIGFLPADGVMSAGR